MPLRIKLDEDLSPLVGEPLRNDGHDVSTVLDQGLAGKPDDDLWSVVRHEGRLLITADKGFGDIRSYPPGDHGGIVLLRPDRESLVDYQLLVQSLIKRQDLAALGGCVAVVTPRGVRIRRPP